jgi:ribonucleoside-diphosphate reductase alpha chain
MERYQCRKTRHIFLDAVLSEFIDKTEGNYYLQGARNFALRHRAWFGRFRLSFLQKNMIPFESMEAKMFNAKAFKQIQEQSIIASKELAISMANQKY